MPRLQPRQIPVRDITQNPERSFFSVLFRVIAGATGAFVVLIGLWLLVPELLRPNLPYFPLDDPAADQQGEEAATIASIRRDLWLDVAMLGRLRGVNAADSKARDMLLRRSRDQSIRAARLAPHDSRVWLVLADLDLRLGAPADAIRALKMSYYTGPGDAALLPLRINLSIRPELIRDSEVRDLFETELRIMSRESSFRFAILWAHERASPESKRILEDAVMVIDPGLLANAAPGPRQ